MPHDTPASGRRGFVARLLAPLGIAALGGGASLAAASPAAAEPARPEPAEAWLRGLNGRHRQYYDVPGVKGDIPLGRVTNFLDSYRDAYGTSDADTRVLFCGHSSGLGYLIGDASWAKYELGKRWSVQDAKTGQPAATNPWARSSTPGAISVESLQRRGVRFVGCDRSFRHFTGDLARAAGRPADEVYQEVATTLLPGTALVPSAVLAMNRAQEEGFTYCYVG